MDVTTREQLRDRLASAYGHLGGVCQMTERGAPFPQLLFQLRAVQAALVKIEYALIEQHLHAWFEQAAASQNQPAGDLLELWMNPANE